MKKIIVFPGFYAKYTINYKMETVVKSTKKCENCVKYLEKMNNF